MATTLNFNVTSRTSPQHATASLVDLEGEIDVLTSPRLKSALAGIVDGGATTIVLNLDRVQYMDSTGLGVIVSAMKRIRDKDGTIVLTGLSPHLAKIFEITGLRKVFDVYPTEGDALKACFG
jgi:anti-sigma B factor antagonist